MFFVVASGHVTCSAPKCSGALMPEDHCCYDVCGAVIHIDTEGTAKLKTSFIQDAVRILTTKRTRGLHYISTLTQR